MNFGVSRRDFMGGALAGAALAGCRTAEKPSPHVPGTGKIPYRVFWTWDNSHNWNVNVPGSQTAGIGNPYLKSAEWFERDYRLSIDWCAAHASMRSALSAFCGTATAAWTRRVACAAMHERRAFASI